MSARGVHRERPSGWELVDDGPRLPRTQDGWGHFTSRSFALPPAVTHLLAGEWGWPLPLSLALALLFLSLARSPPLRAQCGGPPTSDVPHTCLLGWWRRL